MPLSTFGALARRAMRVFLSSAAPAPRFLHLGTGCKIVL